MLPDQADWFTRLAAEQDNLRAALVWSSEAGHGQTTLRVAAALWRKGVLPWELRLVGPHELLAHEKHDGRSPSLRPCSSVERAAVSLTAAGPWLIFDEYARRCERGRPWSTGPCYLPTSLPLLMACERPCPATGEASLRTGPTGPTTRRSRRLTNAAISLVQPVCNRANRHGRSRGDTSGLADRSHPASETKPRDETARNDMATSAMESNKDLR
jgi:hypothetical protein